MPRDYLARIAEAKARADAAAKSSPTVTLLTPEQIAMEQRKSDLPGYGASYRTKVQKAAEAQEAKAIKAAEVQEADMSNYVKLSTGEYVDKGEFNKLSKESQDKLTSLGVSGFNEYTQVESAKFSTDNVQLDTGEWILREDYNKLATDLQSELKKRGVEGYNKWIPEYSKQKESEQTKELEKNYVYIKPKEYPVTTMPTQEESIQATARGKHVRPGIMAFNAPSGTHIVAPSDGGVVKAITHGGWINKDYWNSLTVKQKQDLVAKGIDNYLNINTYKEGQSPNEVVINIAAVSKEKYPDYVTSEEITERGGVQVNKIPILDMLVTGQAIPFKPEDIIVYETSKDWKPGMAIPQVSIPREHGTVGGSELGIGERAVTPTFQGVGVGAFASIPTTTPSEAYTPDPGSLVTLASGQSMVRSDFDKLLPVTQELLKTQVDTAGLFKRGPKGELVETLRIDGGLLEAGGLKYIKDGMKASTTITDIKSLKGVDIAVDYETGRLYDVTNPAKPIGIEISRQEPRKPMGVRLVTEGGTQKVLVNNVSPLEPITNVISKIVESVGDKLGDTADWMKFYAIGTELPEAKDYEPSDYKIGAISPKDLIVNYYIKYRVPKERQQRLKDSIALKAGDLPLVGGLVSAISSATEGWQGRYEPESKSILISPWLFSFNADGNSTEILTNIMAHEVAHDDWQDLPLDKKDSFTNFIFKPGEMVQRAIATETRKTTTKVTIGGEEIEIREPVKMASEFNADSLNDGSGFKDDLTKQLSLYRDIRHTSDTMANEAYAFLYSKYAGVMIDGEQIFPMELKEYYQSLLGDNVKFVNKSEWDKLSTSVKIGTPLIAERVEGGGVSLTADLETGKIYDVSNPMKPVEIKTTTIDMPVLDKAISGVSSILEAISGKAYAAPPDDKYTVEKVIRSIGNTSVETIRVSWSGKGFDNVEHKYSIEVDANTQEPIAYSVDENEYVGTYYNKLDPNNPIKCTNATCQAEEGELMQAFTWAKGGGLSGKLGETPVEKVKVGEIEKVKVGEIEFTSQEWETLPPTGKEAAKQGVNQYNTWVESFMTELRANNIQNANGEWIPRKYFGDSKESLPKKQQEILMNESKDALEKSVSGWQEKLEPYNVEYPDGKVAPDIVSALREGVTKPEVKEAVESLYKEEDIKEITKDKIIEPKNWREQWQVWGEEISSPRILQQQTTEVAKNTNTNILGEALKRIAEIDISLSTGRDSALESFNPELARGIKSFAKDWGNLETKVLQDANKSILTAGEKMEVVNSIMKGLSPEAQFPVGIGIGMLETVTTIPSSIAQGLISSLVAAKSAIVNAKTDVERQEMIQGAILPIAMMGAGMAAWFAGRPQAVTTSPYEAGKTIGMLVGPEKILSAAKALKVKVDPSGLSNTALSWEVDVNRITVPKELNPAQAHEWIGEIQKRWVEGTSKAIRENSDVVIHDPLTGKAIGHATSFQQAVKGVEWHVNPDGYTKFVDTINKQGKIVVSAEDAVLGGMYNAEQAAQAFLGRRMPTDPVYLPTRLTPKDIGDPMDIPKVQELMWAGKLMEARKLFSEMGKEGKLQKKVYTPFKSYIDKKTGELKIEQELWDAPGFEKYATKPTWYSTNPKVNTAETYTTSPIAVGGKPILRERATAVVVDKHGDILLVRDKGRPFSLPGGLVEKGESSLGTVLRELREETGLKVNKAEKIGTYKDKEPMYDANGQIVYIEGRPAFNNHVIYKITVDSFKGAKARSELREIKTSSTNTVVNGKGSYESYVSTIAGKATGKKYVTQKDFKLEQTQLKYGQEVPILWLASKSALEEGLGVPTLAQKYKTELLTLVTDARKLLSPKLKRITTDPEAVATGGWIASNLTGIKLEGKSLGDRIVSSIKEKLTRADEKAIDNIAREVETNARKRESLGEKYDNAFKDEARKMRDEIASDPEFGDMPYKLEPKFRLPINSIEDTIVEGDQFKDKAFIERLGISEPSVKEILPLGEKAVVEKTISERLIGEKPTKEAIVTEKPIAGERSTLEKPPIEKLVPEKIVTEVMPPSKYPPSKYPSKTPPPPTEKLPPERFPPYKPPTEKYPPTKLPPYKPPQPPLKGQEGFESLSHAQKLASIAWKQGWIYHLVYPPYGPADVLHSRYTFPGVKVYKGPKSAYKSLAKLKGGVLPDNIYWNLGLMDITFQRGKGQVRMAYKEHQKGQPKIRRPEGMPKAVTFRRKSTPIATGLRF